MSCIFMPHDFNGLSFSPPDTWSAIFNQLVICSKSSSFPGSTLRLSAKDVQISFRNTLLAWTRNTHRYTQTDRHDQAHYESAPQPAGDENETHSNTDLSMHWVSRTYATQAESSDMKCTWGLRINVLIVLLFLARTRHKHTTHTGCVIRREVYVRSEDKRVDCFTVLS